MPPDLLPARPPASRAHALRLPLRWSRWQWGCLLLAAAACGLLLATDRGRRQAEARETITCDVLARPPVGGAPEGPLEISLSYDALERRPGGFTAPAQTAGSQGQLTRYQFAAPSRGLGGIALRAPGRIETIRVYDAGERLLTRLGAEQFQAGLAGAGRGVLVFLESPKDGSAPPARALLAGLPAPLAPSRWFFVGWAIFYAASAFGVGWLVAQLFAPGRSFDLALHAGKLEGLARLAERSRPWQLGLVLGLALAMAAVSAPNAHPDEYQHVAAARFYREGAWLPPAMGDPRARAAIGPNGLSYHQDLDIVYLLAGKAARVTEWIAGREDVALRLVNVALLAALVALACRRRMQAAAWMLLVSPQLWYVFSYFNGDAMGVFLSFLIVWQLAGRDTLLQRSLDADGWQWGGIVWMGLLLGAVSISKKNYFTLPLLAAGYAAWQCWGADPRLRRRLATRWGAVAVLALGIYGARFEYDQALYGFHKAEALRDVAEALATPEYRPSHVLQPGAHWYLGLRERGTPVTDLLTRPRWRAESFMSFTGLYGWMTLGGSFDYYRLMKYLYLAFGAAVLFGYLRDPSRADLALAGLCLGLCGVTLAASVYFSWAVGFQPQGRYLFPILPILAVLGLRKPEALRGPLPVLSGALIFGASVYSFAFVALAHIPK